MESNARELDARFDAAQRRYAGTIRTFAYSCAWQMPNDIGVEDIEQELLYVLWKCVKNYDPDRGASFNVLFQGSARNHIISMVRYHDTQKRRPAAVVYLEQEDVAAAVALAYQDYSAEEEYLAIDLVRSRLAS